MDPFRGEFAGRVAEIEIDAAGEMRPNSHAMTFPREQHAGLRLPDFQCIRDGFNRHDCGSPARQSRDHAAARAEHVKHDATTFCQVSCLQGREFSRAEENFKSMAHNLVRRSAFPNSRASLKSVGSVPASSHRFRIPGPAVCPWFACNETGIAARNRPAAQNAFRKKPAAVSG